jgi:ribonuclease BN (tRNA processing enzyme)
MGIYRLICVGSSSNGNSYILDCIKEKLLIELGCRTKNIEQAINFDLEDIVGVIVSHSHG